MSENLVHIEYQGCHDGILVIECKDCGNKLHCFAESNIVSDNWINNYLVEFTLEDGRVFRNRYEK